MHECPGAKTKARSMWNETQEQPVKNCAHICTHSHTNWILELKTQCDLSDALVLRSSALFKPTETMIVDPLRGMAATGPVQYADEVWDCYMLQDLDAKQRILSFSLSLSIPLLSFSRLLYILYSSLLISCYFLFPVMLTFFLLLSLSVFNTTFFSINLILPLSFSVSWDATITLH